MSGQRQCYLLVKNADMHTATDTVPLVRLLLFLLMSDGDLFFRESKCTSCSTLVRFVVGYLGAVLYQEYMYRLAAVTEVVMHAARRSPFTL
jgi:hypothetical protein